MDRGSEVHVAVLYFNKAFDLVPHHMLIEKLINIQLNPVLIKWIANFLLNRHQRVVLRGTSSDPIPVTSGVPQGSVLGPSLFLLYIDDIVDIVKHSNIRLFVDDTLLYKNINNIDDGALLQKDLENLHE